MAAEVAGERVTGPRPVQAPSDRQLRQTIRDELRRVLDECAPLDGLDALWPGWPPPPMRWWALDRLDAADSEETE